MATRATVLKIGIASAAFLKARTIAIFRNQEPPPPFLQAMGIHLVRSTEECLNLLIDIDTSLEQKGEGALERVMRTLGLKQSASA